MQTKSQHGSKSRSGARPKFLNLFILGSKMSITAKVSILHRFSGILLFLAIPFILYILHQSLINPDFYTSLHQIMANPIVKLIYLILIWAFMYHLCAGVRFLFLDIHKGVEIKTAKITARIVIIISLILTVLLGVVIW
ncbi:MAG: succinate dehydrogenase, cytochrome b556 subunit [Burkholderiales bacterium]|nr:succinate dehydrogenase, cytochrome b556 subunit [Burkholderiales bacterium]